MQRGSQRTRRIGGKALDVPDSTAEKFNILTSGSCVSVWIWIAIVVGLAVIIVVVATVPNYSGVSRNENGPTRTFRTTTTTTASTTSTTTAAPTTSPALVLSCPSTDYQVPLGYPIDNVALGGVTLTGGCPPLSLTYTDTVVGVINKKRRQFPAFRQINPKLDESIAHVTAASARSAEAVTGIPPALPRDNVALRTETDARSPSYPNANLRLVYQNMIPNTNAYAPNPSIDTNINFVVSAIDSQSAGATIHVYTKAIVELGGSPFQLSSLAPLGHPCRNTGKGQAQVMFDPLANVWVFAELSTSTNATLCVYVSDGPSVITASYMLYALVFPQYDGANTLSYPKLAAFNGYYAASMVYNQTSPVLVIMERTAMIVHSPVIFLIYFLTVGILTEKPNASPLSGLMLIFSSSNRSEAMHLVFCQAPRGQFFLFPLLKIGCLVLHRQPSSPQLGWNGQHDVDPTAQPRSVCRAARDHQRGDVYASTGQLAGPGSPSTYSRLFGRYHV